MGLRNWVHNFTRDKASRQSTSGAEWVDAGLPGFGSATGLGSSGVLSSFNERAALLNPDTFAGIRATNSTIARLPLNFYETLEDGRPSKLSSGPVLDLFKRPGGSFTPQMFWQYIVRCMETHGRGIAIINRRVDGSPATLQPRSSKGWTIEATINQEDGSIVFTYQSPEGHTIPYTDVLDFVFDLHADGTYEPISPVRYTHRLRGLFLEGENKMLDMFNFINAVFLEMPEATNKNANEEKTAEEYSIALGKALARAKEGGNSVVPITAGSKVDNAGSTAQQVQLAESMDAVSTQSSKFYSTSPSIHGDARIGSYRNAEAAILAFTRLKISAISDIIEQEINLKLLEPNQYAKFDTSELLKGDAAKEAQRATMLTTAGIWTPNEARLELGKPLYEDKEDAGEADKLKDGSSMGGANLIPQEGLPNDEPSAGETSA